MSRDFALREWILLSMAKGVGPVLIRNLLEKYESPGAALRAPLTELADLMPMATAKNLHNKQCPERTEAAAAAARWLKEPQHHILTLADADYPAALQKLNTQDPPPLLYVRGDKRVLSERPLVAIVGSRSASPAGVKNAELFAHALAEAGVNIVSGLAQGIDSAAHRGALKGGGKTVAVVGTGADIIYPKQNRALAMEIVGTGGAIVSDFPLGTPPKDYNFPRRNRIISGLAKGCLVAEAARKSGALITAQYASEQGREVFAVPGSINSPMYKGCHFLIKQGAKLAENVDDILDELNLVRRAPGALPLPPADGGILKFIDFAPTALDDIAARSGLEADSLLPDLLTLEMEGKIVVAAGGTYQRI